MLAIRCCDEFTSSGLHDGRLPERAVYKGFDIISDHISRLSGPCTIPPAACGVLYLVAMRMEC